MVRLLHRSRSTVMPAPPRPYVRRYFVHLETVVLRLFSASGTMSPTTARLPLRSHRSTEGTNEYLQPDRTRIDLVA